MLVSSTKLKEVRSFEPRNIVTKHIVLTVPEPGAHTLRVKIVRSQHIGRALAKGLYGSAQARHLWRLSCGSARPEIPQIAVIKVVCDVVGDVRGETRREVPGYLRTIGNRCGHAQLVTREKAPDVHLIIGGPFHAVIAVSGIKVPLGTKVVVQAEHANVILPRQRHVGLEL